MIIGLPRAKTNGQAFGPYRPIATDHLQHAGSNTRGRYLATTRRPRRNVGRLLPLRSMAGGGNVDGCTVAVSKVDCDSKCVVQATIARSDPS